MDLKTIDSSEGQFSTFIRTTLLTLFTRAGATKEVVTREFGQRVHNVTNTMRSTNCIHQEEGWKPTPLGRLSETQ